MPDFDGRSNDDDLRRSLDWLEARLRGCIRASSEAAVGNSRAHGDSPTGVSSPDESTRPKFPLTFRMLADRFGLTDFEQDILLLTVASEFRPGLSALIASIEDRIGHPTFGLALSVFEAPSWDALSPQRPLRYWRLIELDLTEPEEITRRRIRISERILHFIKGLSCCEETLLPHVAALSDGDAVAELSTAQASLAAEIAARLVTADDDQSAPIIELRGSSASRKLAVAREAARRAHASFYCVNGETLPAQSSELDLLARLWDREIALAQAILYVSFNGLSSGAEVGLAATSQFIERCRCPLLVDGDIPSSRSARSRAVFEIESPTRDEQRVAWAAAVPWLKPQMTQRLADTFELDLEVIKDIGKRHSTRPAQDDDAAQHAVWHSCLLTSRPQLDALAERVPAKARFEDIVLPAADIDQLRQIVGQLRNRTQVYESWGFDARMNRGLGICALFSGESGTGKTMAAEVIANELRYDLYRIDLAAIVSKYIGETEKNLRRLFDAAEGGGVILFFDEADALFGKRSEVKDSHDRYANIEVNYLLQKMDSYRGLSILATNRKSGLDSAFLRRIRFVVDFPAPGPDQAKELWSKVFPPGTPKGRLDIDRLSWMKLTGGSIHNIALHAAFLAADRGRDVDTELVLEAARVELRKLGRPLDEAGRN